MGPHWPRKEHSLERLHWLSGLLLPLALDEYVILLLEYPLTFSILCVTTVQALVHTWFKLSHIYPSCVVLARLSPSLSHRFSTGRSGQAMVPTSQADKRLSRQYVLGRWRLPFNRLWWREPSPVLVIPVPLTQPQCPREYKQSFLLHCTRRPLYPPH